MAISEETAGGSARPGPANGGYRAHYIRDAQGNIMATYRFNPASLVLNDRPIYGSSRLGNYRFDEQVFHASSATPYYPPPPSHIQKVDLNYELTDHLGNVAVVVTGRLITNELGITPCQAELVSAQGYEPFGALLPGRNYSSDSYRFGFNGMRKDDEIHGATGTSYDFGARLYDPRVGKWLSLDPLASKYPQWSPYQFVDGNPVRTIDIDGRDIIVLNDREGARGTGHAAVLIGSDETGWTYISKDGASNGSGYGRSKFVIATFKTVAEFAMSQHNFSTLMILH